MFCIGECHDTDTNWSFVCDYILKLDVMPIRNLNAPNGRLPTLYNVYRCLPSVMATRIASIPATKPTAVCWFCFLFKMNSVLLTPTRRPVRWLNLAMEWFYAPHLSSHTYAVFFWIYLFESWGENLDINLTFFYNFKFKYAIGYPILPNA